MSPAQFSLTGAESWLKIPFIFIEPYAELCHAGLGRQGILGENLAWGSYGFSLLGIEPHILESKSILNRCHETPAIVRDISTNDL